MKEMNYHEQERQGLAAATSSNGLDWFEESISSFLAADVDLGGGGGAGGYAWWAASPAAQQDDIGSVVAQTLSLPAAAPAATSPLAYASPSIASPAASSPSDVPSSKKRKSPAHKASGHIGSNSQRRRAEQERSGVGGGKKGGGKGGGAGSDRDMRWAEQLLNPCAVAVEAGNLSRVQHLFYVLGELESFSGDANHRLAAHGLRALARRLPAAVGPAAAAVLRVPACECPTPAFVGAEPRLFRASLIRFHEVSPWFALPNALANAAIAQASTCGAAAAAAAAAHRPLHVVDLGVSHGVQWPTLLESLTRQPGGRAPPSVRLTVAGPGATSPAPFSASPPGYDFSPHLLRYAKSINLDLDIGRVATLDAVQGLCTPGEALVVCLQFRLGHTAAEERSDILHKVRGLNPELVVLSELDSGGDGSAAGEFAARLELLWRFLESTSAAFKGKDTDERRLLETEAGTNLATDVAREGRERWRERMAAAGFEEVSFGAEAVESAKSLLRKYDSGWEMTTVAAAGATGSGAVALRWKGQPVSFCSLWRPA
ncbi:hypothetical protein E2562_031807 [Oryza meyeriana var. granulata]|uniref:Uncharacterized protein n=1 Tax=Oryza meyeriana var. granulata TaxID=110450 RepID=A0A6G1EB26_9ORYZ|nr:hypothetical protein E2562_031807 [Oryza meyeriana var. granulata]